MMKQYLFKPLFFMLLMAATLVQSAKAGDDFEKRKTVERSFNVSKNTTISVDNRHGKVHVDTWNKNQVELFVEIIVRMRSENKAQRTLDRIHIDIQEEGKQELSFETKIDGDINTSRSETLEINYRLKVPKSNPLELDNRYGNIFLADFDGPLEIDLSYGSIKTEKITNKDVELDLSYGNGEIGEMQYGVLETAYFSINVEKLGNVEVDNAYGNVSVEKGDHIILDTRYGDFEIEEVNSLEGEVAYAGLDVDRLTGKLKLEARYSGGIDVKEISSSVKEIEIDSKYSSIDLRYVPDFSADVEVYTQHANLRYEDDGTDFHYINEGQFRKEYKGKINKGGKAKVYVVSGYGDVRLKKARSYSN